MSGSRRMKATVVLLTVACLGVARPADAQEQARARVALDEQRALFLPLRSESPTELCDDTAAGHWAQSVGASGEPTCSTEPGPAPEVSLVRIRYAGGEALFLGAREGERITLVGQLDALSWTPAPGRDGRSRVVRSRRRTMGGWPVLTVETESFREDVGPRTVVRACSLSPRPFVPRRTVGTDGDTKSNDWIAEPEDGEPARMLLSDAFRVEGWM